MRVFAVVIAAATAGTAHADGIGDHFYYQQSYGISSARGEGAPMLGESLQLRIALGWRIDGLQVGPWFGAHLAGQRTGGYFKNLVGGDPVAGDSDLEAIGIDAKFTAPITGPFSVYVRGGPRRVAGDKGALADYSGYGFGAGSGFAISGKVRALGFLFAPMFFSKKGPLINATAFIDQNVEWHELKGPNMSTLTLSMIGTSIGFGAGTHF